MTHFCGGHPFPFQEVAGVATAQVHSGAVVEIDWRGEDGEKRGWSVSVLGSGAAGRGRARKVICAGGMGQRVCPIYPFAWRGVFHVDLKVRILGRVPCSDRCTLGKASR